MLSMGDDFANASNFTKRRRSYQLFQSNSSRLMESNRRPIRTIHVNIRPINKINPSNDHTRSFVTSTDDDSNISSKQLIVTKYPPNVKKINQSSQLLSEHVKNTWSHNKQTEKHPLQTQIYSKKQQSLMDRSSLSKLALIQPSVSTSMLIDHHMSSSDSNSSLFNDRSLHPISFRLEQTSSYGDHDQVLNWKKERKKRTKSFGYCCLCTPWCAILSLLLGVILCLTLAIILFAILINIKSSTTKITTAITRTTTTSTSSVSSTISTTRSSTSSTSSSTTSTTTTTARICQYSCLNETWISSSGLLAEWSFDNTYSDKMNTYNAIPVNNPSFINGSYVYTGLLLDATSNQYLYTPYIPLINASFTIEVWLYPTGYPNPTDHAILGLCTNPTSNQCLHLTIRNTSNRHVLYMSFFGANCYSNGSVPLNTWTHVAFTFDWITKGMGVYLNGINVAYCVSATPLLGTANNVTIGYIPKIVATYGSNFFQGVIDHLTIVNRAKPACEIFDDATLVTYYTFDNGPSLNDSGPNLLSSASQSVSFVSSGHSSQAISFNDSIAYFRIAGLAALGTTNQAFSISFWLRPKLLTGTVVFVSQTATGTVWCFSFIGFATNGSIVAQVWMVTPRAVFGPALSTSSTWYHIVQTWSSTNGLRLYVDNVLVGYDALALSYMASAAPNYVTVANRPNNPCAYGAIDSSQTAFNGDIDDFRIYSRELTLDDICALYKN